MFKHKAPQRRGMSATESLIWLTDDSNPLNPANSIRWSAAIKEGCSEVVVP